MCYPSINLPQRYMVFADECTLNKTHPNQAEMDQILPLQHHRLRNPISDVVRI